MTLSTEIIKAGAIECGHCPSMRRVMPDGEVVKCARCGDPEFDIPGDLATPEDLAVFDDAIFGDTCV